MRKSVRRSRRKGKMHKESKRHQKVKQSPPKAKVVVPAVVN